MRKRISLLLVFAMVFLCAACTADKPQQTEATASTTLPTQSTTFSTETTQPPALLQIPLTAAAMPVISQTYSHSDGTELFTYVFQDIALTLEDPQAAEAVVLDLLNLTDFDNSPAPGILSTAREEYTGQEDWTPYTCSILLDPMRLDRAVLSLYGQQVVSDRNPRSAAKLSVTYDLLSGHRLSLKDILVSDYSADALSSLITEAVASLADDGVLYSDYAYVISDMFSTNTPVQTWYLSQNGLCFYFAPYEIAPYSAGTVVAEVPYPLLTQLLKPEYFPAEQVETKGSVLLEPFADAELSNFSQFAELIQDADGDEYLLHTDGVLQNLRLEIGTWSNDGNFTPEATVFAAEALCADHALLLQLSAESFASVRISYLSQGEIIELPLSVTQ